MTDRSTAKNIDEYIAAFSPRVQSILKRIRLTIRQAAPAAKEKISYKMPAFTLDGDLIYFAAFKKHIGIYPPVRGDENLSKEMSRYQGEKGNLKFPLDEPIPYALISRLVKFRVKEHLKRVAAKRDKRLSMRTIDDYGTFEDAVAKAGTRARALAYQLRTLIAAVMPDVVEVPWPKMRIASYGVGPKKKSEHFCYISAQKEDVNLGFYYGAELPDPEGLLQGTGKLLRHVKIREPEAIRSRAVRQLLKVAAKHRMPARPGE